MPSHLFRADRPSGLSDIRSRLSNGGMSDYADGGPVLAARPHPAYARVTAAGYALQVRLARDGESQRLYVRAMAGEVEAASAAFAHQDAEPGLGRITVAVHPDHRRRGLSTALHLFAEAVSGKTLVGFWGDDAPPPPARGWVLPSSPDDRSDEWSGPPPDPA